MRGLISGSRAPFGKMVIVCLFLFSIPPLYAATPWLHTDGNEIKDPGGSVVILRGVDMIDLGTTELWQGGAIEMIDRLTNKNDANGSSPGWYPKVIRIAVYPADAPDYTSPLTFTLGNDDFYNNLLRPIVDYCKSKDLYAIIDWHYVANTYNHRTTTSQFWQYMAPKFANDSHVLFELFNEPINDLNGDWIFNSNDTKDWLSVRTDMQTWINIVRTYAPNNLILVAGPSYSQIIGPAASYPLTGKNIVMVSHIYPGHWLNSSWGASYKAQISTCLTRYPVFMSEWGFWQNSNNSNLQGTITNYGQPIMDFVEGLRISSSAWVASYDWEPPIFNHDWTLRIGEGNMGGFLKDTLYARRNDDQPQGPYGGVVWSIPGTIEAENYDEGSPGGAYYDTSSGNSGGAYRSDDVDIEDCNVGGHDVNNIETGEWLEYTVDVNSTGVYAIEANVASAIEEGIFRVEFDGVDTTGPVSFPATGDAGTYTNVDVNGVLLQTGTHIMRLAMDSGGWSVNWIKFTKVGSGTGRILREYWAGITGTDVNKLTLNKSKYPYKPTGSELLTKLAGPTDFNDNYATRIRGFLCPTVDGDYTFWIASDTNSELWLSTDIAPANAIKIAYIADGNTDPCEWDKYVSHQSSDPIPLVGGEKYYIEVLHKAGVGHDNVAVAWEGPGISRQVIDGRYLSPCVPVSKCTVKAGKTAGLDSINCSGSFHATAGMFDSADNLIVQIYSAVDDDLVYEQTIDMDSFTKSRNIYSYKHTVRTGQSGEISSLKFDVSKKTFDLQTKNLDLTGLGCPLYVLFDMGSFTGTAVVGEDIVNVKSRIPTRLMRTYKDTLIVTKASAKNSANPASDSFTVKGEIAVADIGDSNLATQDVNVTWGDSQTFKIPAHGFVAARSGLSYKCSNTPVTGGIVTAAIDLDKCTFTISVKGADLAVSSGDVVFGINFTDFNEPQHITLP